MRLSSPTGRWRLEVGLQQLGTDGQWGTRDLPTSRFVSASAVIARWYNSSEISLEARAGSASRSVPTDGTADESLLEPGTVDAGQGSQSGQPVQESPMEEE